MNDSLDIRLLEQRIKSLEEERLKSRDALHDLRKIVQEMQLELAKEKQWRKDFQKVFDEFKGDVKKIASNQIRILIGIGIILGLIQIFI